MANNRRNGEWAEYFIYNVEFLPLSAGSGNVFSDGEIRIDTDSEFEFVKTMYQPATGRFRVQYRDDTSGRFLQKGSQDIRTIGGTALIISGLGSPTPPGFVPFIWPRPYRIASSTTMTVSAADFSNTSYNARISFHGNKVRPGRAPWDQEFRAIVPYVYSLSSSGSVTVGANQTLSTSIVTDKDSAFLVQKIVGARSGECLVSIKDGAKDRHWQNIPTHFDNLVGSGSFPNVLPSPRYIARGATITVTIQDLSGASNSVEINFVGVKLYA